MGKAYILFSLMIISILTLFWIHRVENPRLYDGVVTPYPIFDYPPETENRERKIDTSDWKEEIQKDDMGAVEKERYPYGC